MIAKCRNTGQIGAITASKFLSAGAFMILGEPPYGVCISQGFLNPLLRHNILSDLKNCINIKESLKSRLAADSYPVLRQVLAMNWEGQTAVHSGLGCADIVHDFSEYGLVAAGNMLASQNVINQMIGAFHATQGSLAHKLLTALKQGHLEGVDKRGARSSALVVFDSVPYAVVDLRVDDSDTPIEEIERLSFIYFKDYETVNRRLPTIKNPSGNLGHYPIASLRNLASQLEARGETIPAHWKILFDATENREE